MATFDPNANVPRRAAPVARSRTDYQLPDSSLCYDVGKWSRYLYSQEVQDSAALDGLVQKVRTRGDGSTCETLFGELFGRLYDFDVTKLDEASAHAKEWAPKLHDAAEESDAWKRLRDTARGDSYVSSLATSAIGEELLKLLPEHLPKDETEMRGEIDGLEQMVKAARGKKKRKIEARLKSARADLEKNAYDAEQATIEVESKSAAITQAVERASKDVLVSVERAQGAVDALSGGGAARQPQGFARGAGTGPGTEGRRQLRRVLADSKLLKIADSAGRFRARVRAEKRAKADGPEEIHFVELGDNLQRLLPTEKMALGAGGIMAAMVYSKMLDRGAQQYAVRSFDKRSKGPIVFAIDESGSMETRVGNDASTRETWAKAVSLAVMQRCIEEKRSFAIVHFAGSVMRIDAFATPWTAGMGQVCDAMSYFADGGTDITSAVARAASLARGEDGWKPTEGKADVVLVTDGEDHKVTKDSIRIALGDSCPALHTIGISCRISGALRESSSSVTEYTNDELSRGVLPDVAIA